MKRRFLVLAIFFACVSCCDDSDPEVDVDSLAGLWNLEHVTISGDNKTEHNDSPANFLQLDSDRTFSRAYESGNWNLKGKNLTLNRDEATGISDWSYRIISISGNSLVVEMRLTEGDYLWNFDSFSENEILTIREVYLKVK